MLGVYSMSDKNFYDVISRHSTSFRGWDPMSIRACQSILGSELALSSRLPRWERLFHSITLVTSRGLYSRHSFYQLFDEHHFYIGIAYGFTALLLITHDIIISVYFSFGVDAMFLTSR